MSMKQLVRLGLSRTPIGGVLGRLPFVRSAYAHYVLSLKDTGAAQSGIYASYDEALAAVPQGRCTSWDNPESAEIWAADFARTQPASYPHFFWLARLLREGSRVIDYGGNVGLTYFGLKRLMPLPPGVRWTVVELPAIAERGRRVAAEQGAVELAFETDLSVPDRCDILLSAGTLQYIPDVVPGLLERMRVPPPHIIINKIGLTAQRDFWTLQNFGAGVAPYHIFNAEEFIGYFESAGYRLRDRWWTPDIYCDIPFYPDHSISNFSGFYFERIADRAASQA